jgi:hypothetical protein
MTIFGKPVIALILAVVLYAIFAMNPWWSSRDRYAIHIQDEQPTYLIHYLDPPQQGER